MNAKDQAALEALKTEFANALKLALQPLQDEIIVLMQRSENFATRANAHRVMSTERIRALEAQVLALTPVKPVAAAPRLTDAQWNAAMACLRKAHPGTTFFAPGVVRACAKELADHESFRVQSGLPHPEEARYEEEEVSL